MDDGRLGQKVGRTFDEVIIEYAPPLLKVWETVGQPKLLVIDHYRITAQIERETDGARLTVPIDYHRPKTRAWMGKLFGGLYAKRFINPGTRSRTRRLCRALLSPED